MAADLIIANNDPTERGTAKHIEMLKQCDDVTTYTECGWFCVLGYKGDKRIVHVHFNNQAEYDELRNPQRGSWQYAAHKARMRSNPCE
jgi:hypothetical protein